MINLMIRSHADQPLAKPINDALGWFLFLGAVGAFCCAMLGFGSLVGWIKS